MLLAQMGKVHLVTQLFQLQNKIISAATKNNAKMNCSCCWSKQTVVENIQ